MVKVDKTEAEVKDISPLGQTVVAERRYARLPTLSDLTQNNMVSASLLTGPKSELLAV